MKLWIALALFIGMASASPIGIGTSLSVSSSASASASVSTSGMRMKKMQLMDDGTWKVVDVITDDSKIRAIQENNPDIDCVTIEGDPTDVQIGEILDPCDIGLPEIDPSAINIPCYDVPIAPPRVKSPCSGRVYRPSCSPARAAPAPCVFDVDGIRWRCVRMGRVAGTTAPCLPCGRLTRRACNKVIEPCSVPLIDPCLPDIKIIDPCLPDEKIINPCVPDIKIIEPCDPIIVIDEPCYPDVKVIDPCIDVIRVEEPCAPLAINPCFAQSSSSSSVQISQTPTKVFDLTPCIDVPVVKVEEPCDTVLSKTSGLPGFLKTLGGGAFSVAGHSFASSSASASASASSSSSSSFTSLKL